MSLMGKKDVNNSSRVILFKDAFWGPAVLPFLLGLSCSPSESMGAGLYFKPHRTQREGQSEYACVLSRLRSSVWDLLLSSFCQVYLT